MFTVLLTETSGLDQYRVENESAEHVVTDCSFSKQVWKKVAAWSNLEQLAHTGTIQGRLADWWSSCPKFIRIDVIS